MTEAQLDRVVESYVDAPAPPTPDTHQHHRPSRHLLSILQEAQNLRPRRRGRNVDGPSSLKSGGGDDGTPRKKSPMCLDVGDYEKGITCRSPAPEIARAPPADAADVASTVPPDTHPAPSEETVTAADEMGVVCPSYIAPEHGSVWQGGKEHKIATASGAVPGARVRLSCHEHYRPSRLGSHTPQCLPSGQWENGISCERIYCGEKSVFSASMLRSVPCRAGFFFPAWLYYACAVCSCMVPVRTGARIHQCAHINLVSLCLNPKP